MIKLEVVQAEFEGRSKAALEPYTLDGPWGRLLDAERDDLDEARVQGFEMEELLPHASAARAVLTYLFRRIERLAVEIHRPRRI